MIENITIPHFDITSACAFIHSAFVVPARAQMKAYLSASGASIIAEVHHDGTQIAMFICSPLPKAH